MISCLCWGSQWTNEPSSQALCWGLVDSSYQAATDLTVINGFVYLNQAVKGRKKAYWMCYQIKSLNFTLCECFRLQIISVLRHLINTHSELNVDTSPQTQSLPEYNNSQVNSDRFQHCLQAGVYGDDRLGVLCCQSLWLWPSPISWSLGLTLFSN